MARQNQVDIVIRAIDQASGAIAQINRNLRRLEQNPSWQKISRDSALVAGGLIAAGTAAAGMGLAAVNMAGRLEQAKIAFTTMLGSAEEAQRFLDKMADFAASTPFRFEGLQQSSRLLLAFGFNAEQILPTMSVLGDAVAALGGSEAELNGVVRAIGQIQTKGKVSAEELMQLAERGIPAFEILREKLGLTQEELGNIGNAGISSAEAINALLTGLSERFAGSMEAQSRTLLGLFSTVKDQVSLTMTAVGGDIIEALDLKAVAERVIEQLDELRTRVQDVGLAGMFESIRDEAVLLAGALAGMVVPAAINATIAFSRFFARMAPWAIAGALVVTVLDELGVNLWDLASPTGVIGRASMALRGFANIIQGIGISIANIIQSNINAYSRAFEFYKGLAERIKNLATLNPLDAWSAMGDLSDWVKEQGRDINNSLDEILEGENFQRAQDHIFDGWTQVKNAIFGAVDETGQRSAERIVEEVQGLAEQFANGTIPTVEELTAGLLDIGGATEEGVTKAIDEIDRLEARMVAFNAEMARQNAQLAAQQGGPTDVRAVPRPDVRAIVTPPVAVPRPDASAAIHLEKATGFWLQIRTISERFVQATEPAVSALERGGLPVATPERPGGAPLEPMGIDRPAQLGRAEAAFTTIMATLDQAPGHIEPVIETARTWIQAVFDGAEALNSAAIAEGMRQEQIIATNQLIARQDPRNIARLAQQQGPGGAGTGPADGKTYNQGLVDGAGRAGSFAPREIELPSGRRVGRGDGGLDEARAIIEEGAKSVGTTLLDLANTHIPMFATALQGLASGGPIGAVVAVFAEIASQSEVWADIMDMVAQLLELLAASVGQVLEALMPVIEPILELTAAITPLIEIVAKILTPVMKVLGTVLGWLADGVVLVVNGFISVYNFLLGWLFGHVDHIERRRIDKDRRRKAEERRDADNRAGGGQRIAAITGATRDLLVDLLTPLAHLPTQLVILEQIRDILDTRLYSGTFTGGAGELTVGTVNIYVEGSDDPRETADTVYRLLTNRLSTELRVSAT